MTGTLLLWTGRTLANVLSDGIDGGVWAVDLADAHSVPAAIIPPTDLDVAYGHAARGAPHLTDRGRAVITQIQGITGQATDIIDLNSLTVRQRLEDAYGLEVIDGVALVMPVHGDPDRAQRIRLVDLATGDALGPGVRTKAVWWSVAGTKEVYVQHAAEGTDYLSIIAISLDSGEARQVVAPVRRELSHELSGPEHLVLAADDWNVTPAGGVHQSVTLVDPATGRVERDAFLIAYP
jgi:hypothetical protein